MSAEQTASEPATKTRARRTATRRVVRRAEPSQREAAAVVQALLRCRGARGAAQEEIMRAVSWAREIRVEGEALQEERATRRRARAAGKSAQARAAALRHRQAEEERLRERQIRFEMNRALLEGVTAGTVVIDVQDDQLVFLDGRAVGITASTGPAPVGGAGEETAPTPGT